MDFVLCKAKSQEENPLQAESDSRENLANSGAGQCGFGFDNIS